MRKSTKINLGILGILVVLIISWVCYIYFTPTLWIEVLPNILIVKGVSCDINDTSIDSQSELRIVLSEKSDWVVLNDCNEVEKLFTYDMDWIESLNLCNFRQMNGIKVNNLSNLRLLTIDGEKHPVGLFEKCNKIYELEIHNGTIKLQDLNNYNLESLKLYQLEIKKSSSYSGLGEIKTLILEDCVFQDNLIFPKEEMDSKISELVLKNIDGKMIEQLAPLMKNAINIDLDYDVGFEGKWKLESLSKCEALETLIIKNINPFQKVDLTKLNNLKQLTISFDNGLNNLQVRIPPVHFQTIRVAGERIGNLPFSEISKEVGTEVLDINVRKDVNISSIGKLNANRINIWAESIINLKTLESIKSTTVVNISIKNADPVEVEELKRKKPFFNISIRND